MRYGAKKLMWAAYDDTTSKYGAAVSLGGLVQVTDAPTFNEASAYSDNKRCEYITEFKELSVDAQVCNLSNTNAASLFGTAAISTDGAVVFAETDSAPFGGLAFYITKSVDGAIVYQGIGYYRVKAQPQGATYDTKGDSITLTGDTLHFSGEADASGNWMTKSKEFTTESEAATWVTSFFA